MWIVANDWSELLQGYRRARELQRRLEAEWVSRLKAIHAVRAARIAKAEKNRTRWGLWAVILFAAGLAGFTVGLLPALNGSYLACLVTESICLAWPASLTSGFAYLAARRKAGRMRQEPAIRLEERWLAGLYSLQASGSPRGGDTGEIDLLYYLRDSLPDSYLGVRGLLVAGGLDADVLVLGPTGIWVLESKYLRGRLVVRRGLWRQVRDGHPSGSGEIQPYKDLPPLDRQWLRERDNIQRTLRVRLPSHPGLPGSVQGGLVFTYPELEIDFDGSVQVAWGNMSAWARTIRNSPARPGLNLERHFEALDTLIAYADQLKATPRRSGVWLAQVLYEAADRELQRYARLFGL